MVLGYPVSRALHSKFVARALIVTVITNDVDQCNLLRNILESHSRPMVLIVVLRILVRALTSAVNRDALAPSSSTCMY
jgi:hypothetical protein